MTCSSPVAENWMTIGPHMCRLTRCLKILLWSWDKWLKRTTMSNKFSHMWTANLNRRGPMVAEEEMIKKNKLRYYTKWHNCGGWFSGPRGRRYYRWRNLITSRHPSNATTEVTLSNALNPLLHRSNCSITIRQDSPSGSQVVNECESTIWNNITYVLCQHPQNNGCEITFLFKQTISTKDDSTGDTMTLKGGLPARAHYRVGGD